MQRSSPRQSVGLVLLTTCNVESGRLDDLKRLVESIERAADADPPVHIDHRILLQNCSNERMRELESSFPKWVTLSNWGGVVSLSAARNRLLASARSELEEDAIVAFPDDDAWYPRQTLGRVRTLFEQDPKLDMVFCRFGPSPSTEIASPPRRPSFQQLLSFAGSITIFVRARAARHVGAFNESLGLGTSLGGGEDTDFAIRCYYSARRVLFFDEVLVGHAANSISARSTYYSASLAVIAARGQGAAGALALVRKLLAGLVFIALRRISFADVGTGLAAGRMLRRSADKEQLELNA